MLRGPATCLKSPRIPSLSALATKLWLSGRTITQQDPLVDVHPTACRLGADIPRLGLCIQKKPMIGRNDNVVETCFPELVYRHPDPLQGVVNQAQRRFRVILELAIDIHAAQYEKINCARQFLFRPHEVIQLHLGEAIAILLAQQFHTLVDVGDCQISHHGDETDLLVGAFLLG